MSVNAQEAYSIYAQTEIDGNITINISNDSENWVNYPNVRVEKFVNGNWESNLYDVTCPCDEKCTKSAPAFEPKTSISKVWDRLDSNCKLINSGEYRFVIVDRAIVDVGYLYQATSNTIEVK